MKKNDLRNRLIWIAMNDAIFLGVAALLFWYGAWQGATLFAVLAVFGTAFVLLRKSPAP
jgi:hypothetical protein